MYPNGLGMEVAKGRIADRVRRAEAERRSRPIAEYRMAARREKGRRVVASVITAARRARSGAALPAQEPAAEPRIA